MRYVGVGWAASLQARALPIFLGLIVAFSLSGCAVSLIEGGNLASSRSSGPVASALHSSIAASGPVTADGVASSTVTIVLRDLTAAPLVGVTPTYSVSGSGNTLGSCTVTDSTGNSTCTVQSTVAESKTVSLVSPVVVAGGSVTFTHGAASQLVFATQPAAAVVAGATLSTAPVVEVRDANGNRVTTGSDATASISLRIQSGSGLLVGTTSRAAVAGVADFSSANLRFEHVSTQTLRATKAIAATGALTVDSDPVVVSAPSLTSVGIFSGVLRPQAHRDGPAASAAMHSPNALTSDGTYVYVLDAMAKVIRRVSLATGAADTIVGAPYSQGYTDATGSAARLHNPHGIVHLGGFLYFTEFDRHTIRRVDLSTLAVTTFAGQIATVGTADGVGTAAQFSSPRSITSVGGSLYVGEYGTHRIRKVETDGTVAVFAGGTVNGDVDATGTAARFSSIRGLTSDGTYLFVVDKSNQKIRRVNLATAAVDTLSSGLSTTTGLTYVSGYLYSTMVHEISRIDPSTGALTTFAGDTWTSGFVDAGGNSARFSGAQDLIAVGTDLIVADTDNGALRRVALTTGAVSTWIGTSGAGSGSVDGIGSAARFNGLIGLTSNGSHAFVTDSDGTAIRTVDLATGAVSLLAGTVGSYGGTNGTGSAALLGGARGISTDGQFVYWADSYRHTIRRVSIATGETSTIAGTDNTSGTANGTGSSARFDGPGAVAYGDGMLYVVDRSRRIRRVNLADNSVTSLAGSSTATGCDDGTGTAARFDFSGFGGDLVYLKGYVYAFNAWCRDLVRVDVATGEKVSIAGGSEGNVDGTGSAAQFGATNIAERRPLSTDGRYLYLADIPNGTVRRIDPVTFQVTTVSGTSGQRQDTDGLFSTQAMYNDPSSLYFGFGRAYFGNWTGLRRTSP